MEEQINNLNDKMETIIKKLTNLETNSVSKSDFLLREIKSLTNEISTLKKEMISKNDFKIKIQRIEGKTIVIYAKNSDKISEIISRIKQSKDISENERFLFLDNKLINDDSTIAENNIKKNSNLYLKDSDDMNIASPKEKSFIKNALIDNVNKEINMLLYSARKDGDDAKTFHSKCDNKGELLYLIKTTQDIVFAIYINRPLISDGNTRTDSLQMVISPANNFSIKSKNENATYHCNPDGGATFHCIQLNTPFLSSNCVDITGCSDFDLPSYPSGNSSYQIKDLMVYSVQDIEKKREKEKLRRKDKIKKTKRKKSESSDSDELSDSIEKEEEEEEEKETSEEKID